MGRICLSGSIGLVATMEMIVSGRRVWADVPALLAAEVEQKRKLRKGGMQDVMEGSKRRMTAN